MGMHKVELELDTIGRILEMRNQGNSYRDIAASCNLSYGKVRSICLQYQALPGNSNLSKEELVAFRKAAFINCSGLDHKVDELDLRTAWEQAENKNSAKIELFQTKHDMTVEIQAAEPVCIVFASDQHISIENTVDLQRMREDAELIAKTPNTYVVLGGDGIDNHIKHHAAMLAARSQPSDQWRLFEYYVSILGPSLLLLISGNHECWSNQYAGIDILKYLAENKKLQYAPHAACIKIKYPTVEYDLAVRHQYKYNSSLNLCHTVKRWYDMGENTFDVGVICHHHEPAIESFMRHGKMRWAARPGSYQVHSDYSLQYGFNIVKPTCPSFILYPGTRDIVGFNDVRKACRFIVSEVEFARRFRE